MKDLAIGTHKIGCRIENAILDMGSRGQTDLMAKIRFLKTQFCGPRGGFPWFCSTFDPRWVHLYPPCKNKLLSKVPSVSQSHPMSGCLPGEKYLTTFCSTFSHFCSTFAQPFPTFAPLLLHLSPLLRWRHTCTCPVEALRNLRMSGCLSGLIFLTTTSRAARVCERKLNNDDFLIICCMFFCVFFTSLQIIFY